MKKILLILFGFFFAMNLSAANLKEGQHYIQVNNSPSATPEVIEFFSFYCPACFAYEYQYRIPAEVKKNLPANVAFKQYHVNFFGEQTENLTRAWALAMALGVEDKVKEPLFVAAQGKRLHAMADIRAIFIAQGISAAQFDGGINSFMVNGLVNKQVNLAKQFQVNSIPDFYVNGRFRINANGLDRRNFNQDFINTVNALLQK